MKKDFPKGTRGISALSFLTLVGFFAVCSNSTTTPRADDMPQEVPVQPVGSIAGYYKETDNIAQTMAAMSSEESTDALRNLEKIVQSRYGIDVNLTPVKVSSSRSASETETSLVEILGVSTSCVPEAVTFMLKVEKILSETDFSTESELFAVLSDIDAEAAGVLQGEALAQYFTFSETLKASLHYWLREDTGEFQTRGWLKNLARVVGTALSAAAAAVKVTTAAGPVAGAVAAVCAGYVYWQNGVSVTVALYSRS